MAIPGRVVEVLGGMLGGDLGAEFRCFLGFRLIVGGVIGQGILGWIFGYG